MTGATGFVGSALLPELLTAFPDAEITAFVLPDDAFKDSNEALVEVLRFIMKHDKKFLSGRNRFVLMSKIGKVKVLENISLAVIKKAIKAYQ